MKNEISIDLGLADTEIIGFKIDENADINILKVWKTTKGEGVRVAVIDDAFDVNH